MSEQLDIVLQSMPDADKTAALVKLARTMAHELNNIFTVVVGNLALLDDTVPAGGEVAETLADVRRAAERGIALSARLQNFTGRGGIQRPPSTGGQGMTGATLPHPASGDSAPAPSTL